ncbi:MAG TPA: hypothetical protein VK179_09680 [Bacteroidales bacterium]|nr:hypothetical protein [Bacteroidales bacterium]
MFRLFFVASLSLFSFYAAFCDSRTVINLNGTWDFDQTTDAFPPKKFTRKIPVPGVITMAEPRIEDYDKFFKRPDKVTAKEQHSLYDLDYTPRYSWYKKTVFIPEDLKGKEAVITLKKSQYVTQVFFNGFDLGTSMACYTPVEFKATGAVKYGGENVILVRVGERVWLPSEAAGGTDKEKEHYLPGIWDDVSISFTGDVRINRALILPSVAGKKITAKLQLRNFRSAQIFYGDQMTDSVRVNLSIKEKKTGRIVAQSGAVTISRRDNLTETEIEIPTHDFTLWTPENPELYVADITINLNGKETDKLEKTFGMRDFTRRGKFFYLNGQQYILRGTNITFQRFLEDPDSRNLVWDKEWVKKLLVEYPKQLNWNAMRICVGIVPDFWYDLADQYGLLFQNEWLYWQNHGWDEEINREYTDWIWTDGSHPSIAIWDAINENQDEYIGNVLIPELQKLDPTRIWDAGYMTGDQMNRDEMDEPHPYQGPWNMDIKEFEKHPYPLGKLDYKPGIILQAERSSSAQLVNEYGWIWLWRNGTPSKLTVDVYNYYLGENSTAEENRELQAYWLQCETEWLRSNPNLAGVLAFCYLANNYGYTGDWFINDIKDLEPGKTLSWFRHCFAPAAVFINLTDERYVKYAIPHKPGTELAFELTGVNNNNLASEGKLELLILDETGKKKSVHEETVKLDPLITTSFIEKINLPEKPGGYLLVAEYTPGGSEQPVISRRFIKIGEASSYSYFTMQP